MKGEVPKGIVLDKITLRYEDAYILKDFSLELPVKGAVCLFAPSGSGKTTLLRILCGLEQPQSGSVTWPGWKGADSPRIAMLFQENRLLPHLTALDNLKLVLPRERAHEAAVWLERVGLGGDACKTPLQLSGGMNRRLAIARTLAYGGDVYLLDEPFQGLDEGTLQQMLELIREAVKDALLILVTHRMEEAQALCERIVVLEGKPLTTIPEASSPLP